MGSMAAALLLPSKSPLTDERNALFLHRTRRRDRKSQSIFPVARLFGPAIFEASKLKVLFLGAEKKHPGKHPRTYTLTHSDITSKLTLAISQTINNSQLQGWYNKLQRDEVVAEWKKIKGKMSLHVHCHISGGHFLLDLFSRLRYFIFCKELPVVLKAFVHGDEDLFKNYPELQESLVWVYFHSNIPEFNKVECWGPLRDASAPSHGGDALFQGNDYGSGFDTLQPCQEDCSCCFPPMSLIPWPQHAQVIDDLAAPSESLDAAQTYPSGGSS
ncbi:protein STAY-GREEN homolog, chloroplastic-like [Salvia hispanica]|uniref:protein STAY-GREEN homolog, chloroplastic-like n=1 Tax=Salvia hispanica TaxID=49212 RepID=UPI0020090798|nr:protein STAY-GREEN homolog, chloroplastic-like [Salvia hispanica]